MSAACRLVGKDRKTAYNLRNECPEFAEEWDEIVEAITDDLEQTLLERAINGWEEPVFYKGDECGSKIRFDNGLGWNLLRARRSKIYNIGVGDRGVGDKDDVVAKIQQALREMDDTIEGPPK